MECFFSDSVYVAASNVVKSRVSADDLFIYKVNDSSVALSPPAERKLEPCEIIGLIMLIFKGNTTKGLIRKTAKKGQIGHPREANMAKW